MNSRQERVASSVDNTLVCLGRPAFQIPRLAGLRQELAAKSKEIVELRTTQSLAMSRTAGIDVVEGLRNELRVRHLRPISREGKRLLKGVPGINEGLRIPHKRESDDVLLKATARILKNAEVHAAVFRKALFHPDFIKRARRAAQALKTAVAAKASAPPPRSTRATHDLKRALSDARELIASIDGIVEAEFFGDRAALSMWRSNKRIPKKMGRPKKRRPKDSTGDDQPPA